MQPSTAKIIHVQSEEGNRFYAEAEIVVPENVTHVLLIIDEICPEAHAPAPSDVEAGTHTILISGAGNHRLKSGIRLWLELSKAENCQPRHLSLLRSGPCLGTNPKSRPTKRYIARHPTEYSRSKFELSALTTNFNTFGTIYKQTTAHPGVV